MFFNRGAFMGCVVEMALEIPLQAASGRNGNEVKSAVSRSVDSVEVKLVRTLAALPGLIRVPGDDNPVTTHWFDSKHRLAKAGWQLCIETSSKGRSVTASHGTPYSSGVMIGETGFDAAVDTVELANVSFDAAPAAFKRVYDAAGTLEHVATLTTRRSRFRWTGPGEIAVDVLLDCLAIGPDFTVPFLYELRLSTRWPETAREPTLHALFAAARMMVDALPAFPVLTSVANRARHGGFSHDASPVYGSKIDLKGVRTPHDALIAIGGNIALQWFGNDAGVRDIGGVEFVHQMRVAQRRLKTAIRTFPRWVDEAWTARIAPDITWLGELLGDARDWDVFVDSTLPAFAEAEADKARWSAILDAANTRRLEVRARVRQALGSCRYARLSLAWLEWFAALPLIGAPPDIKAHTAVAYAKKRVDKYYRRLKSAPKLTTLDDETRHRERIRAKRLRYTLEFFEPFATRKTRGAVAKALSRMQRVLGDGNDAVVALGYLEQFDITPYQRGFARGWTEASKRAAAKDGDRLLRALHKPVLARGVR
jgi:CHAD domain-containing protein